MTRKRRRVAFQFELEAEERRALRHCAVDLDLPAAEIVRRALAAFLASVCEKRDEVSQERPR